MIKEALAFLAEQAKAATNIRSTHVQDGRQFLVMPDGTYQVIQPPRIVCNDTLATIPDLVAWLADFESLSVEVYIGDDTVDAIINRTTSPYPHRASMPMRQSQAFMDLVHWCNTPLSQTEAVRKLRSTLYRTAGDLVGVFRSIEFSGGDRTERTVKQGTDSLGKSVHREALSGGKELPDELIFSLPVFEILPNEQEIVPCSLEVMLEASRFMLMPQGDALSDAIISAKHKIANLLAQLAESAKFASSQIMLGEYGVTHEGGGL